MMRLLAASVIGLAIVQGSPAVRPPAPSAQAPVGTGQPEPARERAYRAVNTGVAFLEQFNYQEAERAFRQALEIQPDLALARLNLAIALLYAGQPAASLEQAREAARLMPDTPNAHFVRGLAARGEDLTDEAAAAFERVLVLDPADAGARIHLGQIHLQQRRYPEALRLFEEAVASEPFNVTATYNVALTLTRSGRQEDGAAAMKRFEALRDGPYGVTYAQTYLSQGRYAEAIASTGAEADLVNPTVPSVRFSDATGRLLPAPAAPAKAARGALALFDVEPDGDLDIFSADESGHRFFRNQDGRFVDDTAAFGVTLPAGGWIGAVAGDYDNDGKPDLVLLGPKELRLLHQGAGGRFEDVTAKAGLPQPPAGLSTGALADLDHDGDLDIFVAGETARLVRNNGDGTFADITKAAGLSAVVNASATAVTDFDNRRDVDLILAGRDSPILFRNMRDGTFRDQTSEARLSAAAGAAAGPYGAALAAADYNKDGYTDFFFGRRSAPGLLAASDGRAGFAVTPAPEGTAGADHAQFLDYDNDGLLDLLTVSGGRPRLFRGAGPGKWLDVTEKAGLGAIGTGSQSGDVHRLALGDLDGDGDTDILASTGGGLRIMSNDDGSGHRSLHVRLAARVSNRSGAGARVEMRAGSLRQTLEASSSTPAVAPADLLFGLGSRSTAEAVRVLWPSGILQAETGITAEAAGAVLSIEELDRKPSSCPYLFTWNGSGFEFVTDFMGGGEMGAWMGPGSWNQPDPDEYVRITGSQLRERNSRYDLRMTNELEEALFFDRVQLVSVEHPSDVDVFPNEGLRSPPRPPLEIVGVRGARPPVSATDEHGHDVLPILSALDRRHVDDFAVLPVRGYAEPHELVLDLGTTGSRPVLLLTGWTDYAFSNDNVAAFQAETTMAPPSLQVKDAAGRWRTVIEETGFPVGRPQTIVVKMAGRFLSASREVRILTSMRIHWDRALVGEEATSDVSVTRIDPASADLRWRGLSAEMTPDGREPFTYDYQRVSSVMPWKVMTGRYTREGDVLPLLDLIDDRFVIAMPGDEVAVSFPARPAVSNGRTRTFLFYVHGYSKEMNPRSALPETVGPLPFGAMSGYPYPPHEHYPRSPAHSEYQQEYNTRQVSRPWPSIDSAAAVPSGRGIAPAAVPRAGGQ